MKLVVPQKVFVPYVDGYLSVILGNEKEFGYTLAENFIRCFVNTSIESNWIDYQYAYKYNQYGAFKGAILPSDFFVSLEVDICDFICRYINKGYFIFYLVDTYYISNYISYNRRHIVHPLLIYQIDQQDKSFICRDYFNFINYSEAIVTENEIRESFQIRFIESDNYTPLLLTSMKLDNEITDEREGIILNKKHELNIAKIVTLLKEFLNSDDYFKTDYEYITDTIANFQPTCGLSIIDAIKDHLKLSQTEYDSYTKIKHFRFIEHHIYIMVERCRILSFYYRIQISPYLYIEFSNLLKDAEKLSNLSIKYSIKHEVDLMEKIYYGLGVLKNTYEKLISKLIEELNHYI